MAEFVYLMTKDNFVIKPRKRMSPLLYRTIVLIFAVMCGLYICSICLKEINGKSKIIENVRVMGLPCCNKSLVNLDLTWLHYPKPETFSRAECAQNPVHFFAILSMQRSGSGWFETLLNNHTNVSSNGEIFSVRWRRENASSILQTLDRVYNLDWYSSASKNECSAAIGFKWMLNQGVMEHHQEIVEYFNRRGVSAIFLFRRNLLRRMISELANSYDRRAKLLNGIHKSHVHSAEEADMLSKYKPMINSTSLMTNVIEVESMVAKVLAFFNSTRHIVLFYEDIVKNQTRLRDVQYFLGLPLMILTSRQVKIHRGPVSKLISNWDKVYRALNGTDYERFTHSDYLT